METSDVLQFLATVIFGGVAASLASVLWGRRHAKTDAKVARLESLYMALVRSERDMDTHVLWHSQSMLGLLTPEQAIEGLSRHHQPVSDIGPGAQVQTYIHLYFPEFSERFAELEKRSKDCVSFIIYYQNSTKGGNTVRKDLLPAFQAKTKAFREELELFKSEIAEKIHSSI
ncbi:hypothetical protein [Litchfieldella xinjiangensis]|uniref:hypothetical protein n=1 Tax=Litchfieldella xinjiangensis TaxID=1166948 RepID=UPI0012E0729F|nr:hypothetical protein [Halomonas xinjiangensis]